MNDTGYTTQDVTTLSIEELLDQALQSCYDSGYYGAKPGGSLYLRLGKVAIARRDECFAELRRRLQPACSTCRSVIYPGEPQRTGDDGLLLCADCYGRRYDARDRADEPYRLGDIQYDQSRGHDGTYQTQK